MNQSNAVTLDDCFYFNQKTDLFTGDNRNYCNICRQLYDSHYTSKIYSCPNVLVLILNRGKNNVYDVKLNFEEIIDITKFVFAKDGKIIYKLTGVITHYGELLLIMVKVDQMPTFWLFVEVLLIIFGIDIMTLLLLKLKM